MNLFEIYGVQKIQMGVGENPWIFLVANDGHRYMAQMSRYS